MRHFKATLGVVCVTALLTAAATPVVAQDNFNRTTKITFSAPVELPTMTLPAGTYTFRLTDSTSDRHVVQVFDADGAKLVTMLHAMPVRRSKVEDVHVVTFRETAFNTAAPLRFWYYPADYMGQEFAYPKARALAIAAATGESVLAIENEQITRVEPPAPVEPAPVTPPETRPIEPVQPVQPEMAPAATAGRLPQTAGAMPLVGLIGLLALGSALTIRAFRKSAV